MSRGLPGQPEDGRDAVTAARLRSGLQRPVVKRDPFPHPDKPVPAPGCRPVGPRRPAVVEDVEAGLGLLVTAADPVPETGNPFARIPAYVLGAYLNTYGWGLMLTAAAIAFASVATISVWLRGRENASGR
ncbi:hypothetical protein [Nonomuraea sp. NEAU-A123]|uniref:hypothetical protein n=1 Tax=Nonomuraea sp. NEAU-A123 TaxID=2839649 RepID=UPI001BE46B0A|nr:hypothetical protein [Nonomuraea sp. NEAU-A123]MBT2224963.1 hypothetical protein [Nonomuraea sp. NEAU-A123]